jgi:Terminase-like family.
MGLFCFSHCRSRSTPTESPITHLLIAGAAGVSKSFGARWNLFRRCRAIGGYRALILRTTFPELERNHLQFCSGETKALGDAEYKAQPRIARFFHGDDGNDALIYAGYCDTHSDIANHLGAEWDEVNFDEAVTFLPEAISEITTRARGSNTARISHELLGLRAGRTRLYSNPGGRAMRYLVAMFIRKNPDRDQFPNYNPEEYGFISCTLEDNPYLDKSYPARALAGLSAARYEQLRFGRWDIHAGTFFQNWDSTIHLTHDEAT